MGWFKRVIGVEALERQLADQQAKLTKAEEDLAAKTKLEEEPSIDIKSSGIDDNGEVRLELEWNDSFINHLKENGYEGHTEDDIVNQWLNSMMARYGRPDIVNNGIDALDRESDDLDGQ